jgi:hypothetical protein
MIDDFHGKDVISIVITTVIYNVSQLTEIAKENMTRIADVVENHKGNWDKRYY